MTVDRSRPYVIALIVVCLLVLGVGAWALWGRHGAGSGASSTLSPAQADQQVCSHVTPGALGAGGDWDTPAVASIAFNDASPLVRDAYGAAAAVSPPPGATPEQIQTVMAAWGHLGAVCAAVAARQ